MPRADASAVRASSTVVAAEMSTDTEFPPRRTTIGVVTPALHAAGVPSIEPDVAREITETVAVPAWVSLVAPTNETPPVAVAPWTKRRRTAAGSFW